MKTILPDMQEYLIIYNLYQDLGFLSSVPNIYSTRKLMRIIWSVLTNASHVASPRWRCTACMWPAWPSMPRWATPSSAGPTWPCWTQSLTSVGTGPPLWLCGWWTPWPLRSVRGPSARAATLQRRQGWVSSEGENMHSAAFNYFTLINWQFCFCSHLQLCVREGGACVTTLDGYYVESVVCVVIGLVWWVWLGKKMRRLQEQSPAAWKCRAS